MSGVIIYCPSCRAEYRDGFVTCSDCELPLARRSESAAGQHLLPIARETSFEFVAELLDDLEQHQVPYVVQAGTALRFLDETELADDDGPEPWEARIWVTSGHERLAKERYDALLDKWRRERGAEIATRYLDSTTY